MAQTRSSQPRSGLTQHGVYPNYSGPGAHLPRYSTLSVATLPVYPAADELDIASVYGGDDNDPPFGISRRVFEFGSGSTSTGAPPAVMLQLSSQALASSQRPRYIGGENVEGRVLLKFEKPQAIKGVAVLLRGRLVTSALDEGSYVFVEHTHTVWSGISGVSPPTSDEGSPGEFVAGKLKGSFALPFSFPFPTKFSLASKKGGVPTIHPTPQTVMEKGIYATVVYEVIVKVTGGFLRATQKITANVLYIPILRSPEMPILRSAAYSSGSQLCSPLDDPEGWAPLPPFRLRIGSAKAYGQGATMTVECSMYIANPTTYTRGTVLPCYLICRTTDPVATSSPDLALSLIETLLSQECISASLTRVVDVSDVRSASLGGQYGIKFAAGDHAKKVGNAVWWRPRLQKDTVEEACAEGEIHLSRTLLPSCDVSFLRVSYAVSAFVKGTNELNVECLTEFQGNGPPPKNPTTPQHSRAPSSSKSNSREYHSKTSSSKLASSISVEISTVKGHGPLPLPFTPRPPPEVLDKPVDEGSGIEPVGMTAMSPTSFR